MEFINLQIVRFQFVKRNFRTVGGKLLELVSWLQISGKVAFSYNNWRIFFYGQTLIEKSMAYNIGVLWKFYWFDFYKKNKTWNCFNIGTRYWHFFRAYNIPILIIEYLLLFSLICQLSYFTILRDIYLMKFSVRKYRTYFTCSELEISCTIVIHDNYWTREPPMSYDLSM